jgi:hypothetical protein
MGNRRHGRARASLVLCAILFIDAAAAAQGFYYREIRRDDRIYVFNIAAEAERFEQSGEMGRSLTRVGAGPNGETVVADSERALQLFFFKHGIAEVVPEPAPPVQRIEWRDGKTRITTENAYLEISNRLQVRYTHEVPDDTVRLPGTAASGDAKGSFRVRRAKFKLEGWFWMPALTYELQLNWPDVGTATRPGNMLEDAVLGWDLTGTGRFRVLAGQFKAPFGRQEMTSSGNHSLIDRALVSNEYARGREAGVAVQGVLGNNRVEYRAGLFNGNGRTQAANDNDSFQYNARLMWQPNGSQTLVQRAWVGGALYSEGDFESTTVPLYALAVNVDYHDLWRTTASPASNLRSTTVGIDGVFKYRGFFATSEYFWRKREREQLLAGSATTFSAPGYYVQLSHMLDSPRTWEAAFRYGRRDANDTVGDDDVSEIRVGISHYARRHALKLQADFGRVVAGLGPERGRQRAHELRIQTQFIF